MSSDFAGRARVEFWRRDSRRPARHLRGSTSRAEKPQPACVHNARTPALPRRSPIGWRRWSVCVSDLMSSTALSRKLVIARMTLVSGANRPRRETHRAPPECKRRALGQAVSTPDPQPCDEDRSSSGGTDAGSARGSEGAVRRHSQPQQQPAEAQLQRFGAARSSSVSKLWT